MIKPYQLPLVLVLAVAVTAPACGGAQEDYLDETTQGAMCGGIAALECPSGQTCELEGTHPDTAGTCIKETPRAKTCGGIAGLPCPEGLTCKLDGSFPDSWPCAFWQQREGAT